MRSHRPELIDPRNAVSGETNRALGIESPREMTQRIETLEGLIASMSSLLDSVAASTRNRFTVDTFYDELPASYGALSGQVVGTGATPTVAKLTAAGTTATVAGSFAGTDTVGLIELIPGGTGIASGSQLTLTFSEARASANYAMFLQPATTAARTAGSNVGPTTRTTTSVTLTSDIALTSGSTYRWFYFIVGYD